MELKCTNCKDEELVEVNLNIGVETIQIDKLKGGFNLFGKINKSDVSTYVCPKCGYIQLIAKYPELFKR